MSDNNEIGIPVYKREGAGGHDDIHRAMARMVNRVAELERRIEKLESECSSRGDSRLSDCNCNEYNFGYFSHFGG